MSESKCSSVDDGEKCPYASQAAKDAVQLTFAIMGVDVDKPDQVEEYRRDLRFGGDLRKMADKGRLVFVAVLTAMGVGVFFLGIGEKIKSLVGK